MTSHSFQIDPHVILGVTSKATLQEIREAYHRQSKRYHPDLGGEEWTFRILYQAYEILSQARVARAAAMPMAQASATSSVPSTTATVRGGGNTTVTGETIRRGVRDKAANAASLVAVEILWIRFEAERVWLFQAAHASQDDRSLSCCVNISWPDASLVNSGVDLPADPQRTLALLKAQVEAIAATTKPVSWHTTVDDGRFTGLLSYPTADPAWVAFRQFKDSLHGIGFGVNQWSRDIVIPREWR